MPLEILGCAGEVIRQITEPSRRIIFSNVIWTMYSFIIFVFPPQVICKPFPPMRIFEIKCIIYSFIFFHFKKAEFKSQLLKIWNQIIIKQKTEQNRTKQT